LFIRVYTHGREVVTKAGLKVRQRGCVDWMTGLTDNWLDVRWGVNTTNDVLLASGAQHLPRWIERK
jgi:hypothetical protein